MRFDMSQVLVDYKGEELEAPVTKDGKVSKAPFTLRHGCCEALMSEFPDDKQTTMQKLERETLAGRIYMATGPVELTAKDITIIQDRAAKGYGARAFGPICRALENPVADPQEKQ